MSRLKRAVSAPWRLALAMRRHGVGPVVDFVVLQVRRRGAFNAMRLGLADKIEREAVADEELVRAAQPSIPAAQPQVPADLDDAFTLSAAAWDRWAPWVGARAPSPDPYDDAVTPPTLTFVIAAPRGEASQRRSTEVAARALGAVWSRTAPLDPERWHVFLRPGDKPGAELATEIGRAARGGRAEVVSFDRFRRTGQRVQPLLLPGANPTLLKQADYLQGRVALRGDALSGAPADLEAADPHTLLLSWLEGRDAVQARGRWRHAARPVLEAAITDDEMANLTIQAERARSRPVSPTQRPPVSVVICTRDKGHLTRQLVRSLLREPASRVAAVAIVANNTRNPYALEAHAALEADSRVTRLVRDEPFNFSKLSNAGAIAIGGEGPLLFLNDDIVPIGEDWLDRLQARLDDPAVGSVGPLLLYPDERVQHAGMYVTGRGVVFHTLRGAQLPEQGYFLTAAAAHEVSCVTGAVLLVRREAYAALGGFDEQLPTFMQDVDLGLRLRAAGWVNVFEPASVLLHMESASIRTLEATAAFHKLRDVEYGRFMARWAGRIELDPHHPAGFDPTDPSFRRLSAAGGVRPPMRDGLPEPRPF